MNNILLVTDHLSKRRKASNFADLSQLKLIDWNSNSSKSVTPIIEQQPDLIILDSATTPCAITFLADVLICCNIPTIVVSTEYQYCTKEVLGHDLPTIPPSALSDLNNKLFQQAFRNAISFLKSHENYWKYLDINSIHQRVMQSAKMINSEARTA